MLPPIIAPPAAVLYRLHKPGAGCQGRVLCAATLRQVVGDMNVNRPGGGGPRPRDLKPLTKTSPVRTQSSFGCAFVISKEGGYEGSAPSSPFFLLPWWLLSVQPQGAQTGIYAKRTTDKAFVCYRMENSAGREFQSMRSTWEILNVTMAKLNIISLANKWKLLAILAK